MAKKAVNNASTKLFDELRRREFDVQAVQHAEAIMSLDIPDAAKDIEKVLLEVRIAAEELIRGGGGEADNTQRLRRGFHDQGWAKKNFEITKTINGMPRSSISHEIDHVKQFGDFTIALEIEWNNKDPFFDRDLENFQRLHAERAISLGVIVTRGQILHESLREIVERFAVQNAINSVEDLAEYYAPTDRQKKVIRQAARTQGSFAKGWARAFVSDKFGESTTHWKKLKDRVDRGVGHPCPLVLIGLPANVVVF